MSCELSECTYFAACQLAESVVSASGDAFIPAVKTAKLREIALTNEIFKLASQDCSGTNEENKCGSSQLIGEARSIVFGGTGAPLSSENVRTLGYASQ